MMPTPPEFGFAQLIPELLRGLADAVADRPGETEAQRFARHRAAIFSVMAFQPRDAVETMLAGQCVMLDHLLRDATHDLLGSETMPGKLRIRSQITALGRSFLNHLKQFRLLQAREGQQTASPDVEPGPPRDPHRPPPECQPAPAVADPNPEALPSQSVEAASAALQPPTTPPGGKADLLQQRGFQNRRMRRALQFKTSAKHPVRNGSALSPARLAVVPQPAAGSG